MENSLAKQKQILSEINKIVINFRKCNKTRKTAQYKQSRLEKLESIKNEYENIYSSLAPHRDQEPLIEITQKEIIDTYKNALEIINNYTLPLISQADLTFEELINTILSHLQHNLSTKEFEDIQDLVDSYDEDDSRSELYQNLLENVLAYHTQRENSLIQENTELVQQIATLKKLTKKLQEESDTVDLEVGEQIILIEDLQKERNRLHKKINQLERDRTINQQDFNQEEINEKLIDKENDLTEQEKQIDALKKLLSTTQDIHNRAISILQEENKKLKNFIIKLTKKQSVMAETLHDVTKQVNAVVPVFTGENNKHLVTEVNVFLNTCRMVYDSLTTAPGRDIFLKYIATRCRGDAYDLINRQKFENLDELAKILTDNYLPLKTVGDFKEELHRCSQRPGETLTEYGFRLKRVLWECIKCVEEKYKDGNDACIKELEIEAIDVFRAGIINMSVRHYLLTIKSDKLEKVIEEAYTSRE